MEPWISEHEPMDMTVSSPAQGICVVHVVGELDMLTAPALAALLRAERANRPRVLVIDLTNLEFMGSSGLQVLVDAKGTAGDSCQLALIISPGHAVMRLLDITGLTPHFEIFPTVSQAVAALYRQTERD